MQADSDAIDKLSLSIIPLSSQTLKSARLIKNARMETAVELHNDPISGSLQLQPEDIAEAFAGSEADQAIISSLAALHSYDVYSMRASLKKLGIAVDDETLSLSGDMKQSLRAYTIEFTKPLVEKIFGAGHIDFNESGSESLQKIFRDSDAARVRSNLQTITARTGIPMEEIPAFLEGYSDVFLSVAYYRHSFESMAAEIGRFMEWIKDLQKHRDITMSPQSAQACKKAEDTVKFLALSLRDRLKKFNDGFEMFWSDINRTSFENLKNVVESNHTSTGAVLCGLMVKLRNWSHEFPDNTVGGPQKRAKFVITEMEPGLEKLKAMEMEARKQLGL